MINWQLDAAQVQALLAWLEYLADIVDEDDDDYDLLERCRVELVALVKQDAELHPAEIQPELPS